MFNYIRDMTLLEGLGKEQQNNQKITNKMAIGSPQLSIINLNVNGLNIPIKIHEMTKRIKNSDPTVYLA